MADLNDFVKAVIEHEGLEPGQTPFRITSPGMKNWTSMFDNTIRVKLNPGAVKSKGRENFLYTQNPQDVNAAVAEQFKRYAQRNPKISVSDAVRTFDQTGAAGKLQYLAKKGIDTRAQLQQLITQQALAQELQRQVRR